MSDYGYTVIGTLGNDLQLIASDFEDVLWKPVGITIDWLTVAAVVSDVTLANGTVIKAGQKYIPMGTVVVKETTGAHSGYYGPADTTAADGRQTVDATRRGEVYLMNTDWAQNAPLGLITSQSTDHPPVFNEGTIWKARLQVGGTNQPTLANFLLAFPGINFVSS